MPSILEEAIGRSHPCQEKARRNVWSHPTTKKGCRCWKALNIFYFCSIEKRSLPVLPNVSFYCGWIFSFYSVVSDYGLVCAIACCAMWAYVHFSGVPSWYYCSIFEPESRFHTDNSPVICKYLSWVWNQGPNLQNRIRGRVTSKKVLFPTLSHSEIGRSGVIWKPCPRRL